MNVELTVVWFHVRLFQQPQLNDKLRTINDFDKKWQCNISIYCGRYDGKARAGRLLYLDISRPALGPIHSSVHWLMGPHSLEIKRPGCEADHSLKTLKYMTHIFDAHCRYGNSSSTLYVLKITFNSKKY